MKIEYHDKLRDPITTTATRIIVYDDFDNPIAIAVQLANGQYVAGHAGNDSFKKLLEALGIHKTLIVDRIDAENIKPLQL